MFLRFSEHEIKFLVIVVERTVGEAGFTHPDLACVFQCNLLILLIASQPTPASRSRRCLVNITDCVSSIQCSISWLGAMEISVHAYRMGSRARHRQTRDSKFMQHKQSIWQARPSCRLSTGLQPYSTQLDVKTVDWSY
jgi:hypothetical protein